MKKLLLISIILVSSLGLIGCGGPTADPDVDKIVSITCGIFWGDGMIANFGTWKIEEMTKLREKIEKKYKGKDEAFGKIMEASYLRQCPEAYKKMQEMENNRNDGIIGK